MEQKLLNLYEECLKELSSIGIDLSEEKVGKINISLAKRKTARYGCCKQEKPDKEEFHYIKRGRRKYKIYDKFLIHNIEISKWVMDLDKTIIKNTIIHEIIHCLPYCNNHGKEFKKYANYINENLPYNISRVGNKKEDYEKSNKEFNEESKYKYKIRCKKCGYIYLRKRLKKDFTKKYRCGKCQGKLELVEILAKNEEIKTDTIKEKKYYTYILRCEDNSLYTGITTDIERRMKEHFNKTKKCAKYTKNHTPIKLEAVWQSKNRVLASRLEFYIKTLQKNEKEELIKKDDLEKFLGNKIEVEEYKKVISF